MLQSNTAKQPGGGGAAKPSSKGSLFSSPARLQKSLEDLVAASTFRVVNDCLKAFGRPLSESGVKNQGEHVTAIALITKGFTRQFNRSEMPYREKKKLILKYIERLSVLERFKFPDDEDEDVADAAAADPDSFAELEQSKAAHQLLICVSSILENYNNHRIYKSYIANKKEDLTRKTYQDFARATDLEDLDIALGDTSINDKQVINKLLVFYTNRIVCGSKAEITAKFAEALHSLYAATDSTPSVTKEAVLQIINQNNLDKKSRDFFAITSLEKNNEMLIIQTCETLSTLAIAYYNRLRGVAFNNSAKVLPKPADKISEANALKYLGQWHQSAPHNATELIANIEGLFDYAEVQTEIKGKAGWRDNDVNKLIFVMARHLHLVINAYPEIFANYGKAYSAKEDFQEEIVQPFIHRLISRTWPSIDKSEYKEIEVNVRAQIKLFAKENKFLISQLEDLDSSPSSSSNSDIDEEQTSNLGKSS